MKIASQYCVVLTELIYARFQRFRLAWALSR
jgi:hypothetical protein